MSSSFQNEIPKARVNLKLDLHTGGGQKKVELPLKLLVAGDFSNGQEERPLSERVKTDINKNNFNDVLADISPSVRLNVENTLAGDGSEESISLTFRKELEKILRDPALSQTLRDELRALVPEKA